MPEARIAEILQPLEKTIAAIDLGSNSFHMVIGKEENDQFIIIDRLREPVRLGEGIDRNKQLDPIVGQRALDCLERFKQRLSGIPKDCVRAVGTNTMRQIDDDSEFYHQAINALGYEIEVISGSEEARLVYLGVTHGLESEFDNRLVVDIGGGSTEIILGKNKRPGMRDSLSMGCVTMTMAMFDDGKITASKMESAILRGALEIRGVRKKYKPQFWDIAIGSSGTIKAIAKVIEAQGWGVETITADALAKLRKAIIKKKEIDKLDFEGLSDSRKPVFVGGVAVLTAVFNALDIQEMQVSTFALREGLLYELLGSMHHEDIRDSTIEAFQQRFNVDSEYAGLVEKTAIRLLTQVENTWDLESTLSHQLLSWAAKAHEIGISLTHSAYQKHSAYILANAEMPGFTRQQQEQLATIVRNHRKKIETSTLESITKSRQITVTRLIILLRIAIILHRGRTPGTKPNISIEAKEKKIKLHFPTGWLYRHPLNQAELEQEIGTLKKLGYSLKLINDD